MDALKVFGANLEAADTDALIFELKNRLAEEDPPRVLHIELFSTAKVVTATKTRRGKAQ